MPIEFYIISIILGALQIVAIVFSVHLIDVVKKIPTSISTDAELIEVMAVQVEAMNREFLPADGASMSYRINTTQSLIISLSKIVAELKSANEEARNEARGAREAFARATETVGKLQGTLDAITIAIARLPEAAAKIFQNISQDNSNKDIARDWVGRDSK